MKKRFAFGFIAVLLLTAAAVADPPSRVARLQYINGDVSIQPGGVNDWVAAVVNRPLTTADRVWTDKDSRSELQLGGAFVRMNSETSLTLTNVSDQTVQVELDQGTLSLRIRRLYEGEIYEVDTPNMAFTIAKAGSYRFDVDPNADHTAVTVWRGEGEATGEGRAIEIHKNQQVQFTDGTSLEHQFLDQPDPDGFDDWCDVRDRREDQSVSARYVSPDVIGYEDLDGYGSWRVVPDYGPIWVPTVAVGWAPYRYGHWVWIDPWGWTWVDDEPWGFAPAHYGRWVFYSGRWGWVPGPARVRPVYAPALVAWVGGTHWGVSMTFGGSGGVAWFPLGYGEPYVPPYHVTRNYFQQVNVSNTKIVNITNVTNNYYVTNNTTVVNNTRIVYKNQNVEGAVTAVPKTVLVNSQPVGRVAVQVPRREIASVPPSFAPEVAPSKTSVLGSGGQGPLPPTRALPRTVVTRVAPPERPVPFTAKQQALATHPGRPLDEESEQRIRRTMPQPTTPQPTYVRGGTMQIPPQSAPGKPNPPAAAQPPVQGNPNPVRPVAHGPERMVPRPPQAGGPQPGNSAVTNHPVEGGGRGMSTDADKGMTAGSSNTNRNVPVVNRPVPRPPMQPERVSTPATQGQPGRANTEAIDRPAVRPPVPNRNLSNQSDNTPVQRPNSQPERVNQPVQPTNPEVQRPNSQVEHNNPQPNVPRVERTNDSPHPRSVEAPVYRENQRPNVQPAVREQRPATNAAPASAPEQHHEAPSQSKPAQSKPAQQGHGDEHNNHQR